MDLDFAHSFKKPQLTGNWFLDLNPLSKLNILIVLAIVPMITQSWKVNIGMIAFYFLLAGAAGCFNRFSKMYIRFGVMFGSLLFIMRALFIPGETPIFKFWFITITQESINKGIAFSTMVVAICGAVMLYSVVTRAKDFMYALEKIGAPHTTSYIILSSFQAIIDLGNMSKVIMESQKARGIETEGNIRTRFKAFIPILGPLFLGAISSTEEKAIALDARAFSIKTKNTHLCHLRPVPVWEVIFVVVVNVALLGFIVWRVMS
ncbi:energy-coupling factor transporter transmembrane component T [Brevibacillus choshinensis]|uniref:energy-coupling factor transporter transmembrane component T n=1 Tax=Brevibacillus choshinensis TaxID=54911 RepID=UPI002E2440FC|nr:energy-coupling factor transporter transmembrane component T [Brevibacillus choshinensis]